MSAEHRDPGRRGADPTQTRDAALIAWFRNHKVWSVIIVVAVIVIGVGQFTDALSKIFGAASAFSKSPSGDAVPDPAEAPEPIWVGLASTNGVEHAAPIVFRFEAPPDSAVAIGTLYNAAFPSGAGFNSRFDEGHVRIVVDFEDALSRDRAVYRGKFTPSAICGAWYTESGSFEGDFTIELADPAAAEQLFASRWTGEAHSSADREGKMPCALAIDDGDPSAPVSARLALSGFPVSPCTARVFGNHVVVGFSDHEGGVHGIVTGDAMTGWWFDRRR